MRKQQAISAALALLATACVVARPAPAADEPREAAVAADNGVADQAAADAKQKQAEEEARKKEAAKREQEQVRAKAAADAQSLQAELRKVVVTDLDPASDGPQPKGDQKALQVWSRKQLIRSQAVGMEGRAQGEFRGALELIRQACPGLAPEVRGRALEAGMLALRKAALETVNAQYSGSQPPGSPSEVGLTAALAVIRSHAAPEQIAALDAEISGRAARRRRNAQTLTLAAIDAELKLSASQRVAITAALERGWQDPWTVAAWFNAASGGTYAPDYAADCILPSLTPRQRESWTTWCSESSWKAVSSRNPHVLRQHYQSNLGVSLQADQWWGN